MLAFSSRWTARNLARGCLNLFSPHNFNRGGCHINAGLAR